MLRQRPWGPQGNPAAAHSSISVEGVCPSVVPLCCPHTSPLLPSLAHPGIGSPSGWPGTRQGRGSGIHRAHSHSVQSHRGEGFAGIHQHLWDTKQEAASLWTHAHLSAPEASERSLPKWVTREVCVDRLLPSPKAQAGQQANPRGQLLPSPLTCTQSPQRVRLVTNGAAAAISARHVLTAARLAEGGALLALIHIWKITR